MMMTSSAVSAQRRSGLCTATLAPPDEYCRQLAHIEGLALKTVHNPALHIISFGHLCIEENRGCSPAPDRGGERAAVILTLIQTCRLYDVDPQAWLADVLARINDHAIHRLNELLPWNWSAELERRKVAA